MNRRRNDKRDVFERVALSREHRWWRDVVDLCLASLDVVVVVALVLVTSLPVYPDMISFFMPSFWFLTVAAWVMSTVSVFSLPVLFILGIMVDFLAKTPFGATSLAYIMLLEMARTYSIGVIGVRPGAYVREWCSVVAASALYTVMMTLVTAVFSSMPWSTALTVYGLQLLQWGFVLILFSFVCYPLLRRAMLWLVVTIEARRPI